MKKAEESASVPKTAPPCGCGHAAFYVLLLAVAAVVAAQWSVDPTTGGIAGFVGSALQLPPQGTWRVLGLLGGWLAGTLLAASVAKRALPADRGRAVWRRAFVLIGSALSAGLAGLLYTAHGDLPRAVMFCCAAPGAGAVILVHLPHRRRVIATTGITAGAALIVVGLIPTQQPSSARAGTDLSAFTGQERVYAKQVLSADEYYGCDTEFETQSYAKSRSDYLSRVINIEPIGAESHLMRVQISNWMRLPSYTVSVYLTKETTALVRREYVVVCLTDGPERRAEEVGGNGVPYPAPWRWQRSNDGGASWADVPHSPHHSPHLESDKTARYTFRYVPTRADLADERVRLRACVNVRGGGEVCSAGASPRL